MKTCNDRKIFPIYKISSCPFLGPHQKINIPEDVTSKNFKFPFQIEKFDYEKYFKAANGNNVGMEK